MRLASGVRDRFRAVLGMNARNLEVVDPLNPRELLRLAASKLRTKELLAARGIPVPPTLRVIRNRRELRGFDWNLPAEFALKPGGGWRGGGIVVTTAHAGKGWRLIGGGTVSRADLMLHVVDILDGSFSLVYGDDEAFFEPRLRSDRELAMFQPFGLPDVRVLVFETRPVLAMLRLPTRGSAGRANLHQGGVGVGVDLESGRTVHAAQRRRQRPRHPDTGIDLIGLTVPRWSEILELAVRASRASRLAYVGVDVVIDDEIGPVVLEVNGRPGLDIQIANRMGLRPRLALR